MSTVDGYACVVGFAIPESVTLFWEIFRSNLGAEANLLAGDTWPWSRILGIMTRVVMVMAEVLLVPYGTIAAKSFQRLSC